MHEIIEQLINVCIKRYANFFEILSKTVISINKLKLDII